MHTLFHHGIRSCAQRLAGLVTARLDLRRALVATLIWCITHRNSLASVCRRHFGQENLLKVNWQEVTYPTIRIVEGGIKISTRLKIEFPKRALC